MFATSLSNLSKDSTSGRLTAAAAALFHNLQYCITHCTWNISSKPFPAQTLSVVSAFGFRGARGWGAFKVFANAKLIIILLCMLFQVQQSFATSLKNLQTDYIDSLVLHSPLPTHSQSMEGGDLLQQIFAQTRRFSLEPAQLMCCSTTVGRFNAVKL